MPNFQTIRRVPFSADHMYGIVADIERYPDFLPMCEALTISSEAIDGTTKLVTADMTVAYKAIRETFSSNVTLSPTERRITSKSFDGPFKHLLSNWEFAPVSDDASDIHYSIEYEFKNWLFQKVMGSLFEKAVATYTSSFENRAADLLRDGDSLASKL